MRPASRTRAVTNPRAAVSLCRFATGNSTTAVPMPAKATMTSVRAPHSTPRVATRAQDESGVIPHRAVQLESGDRHECDEVQDSGDPGGPPHGPRRRSYRSWAVHGRAHSVSLPGRNG